MSRFMPILILQRRYVSRPNAFVDGTICYRLRFWLPAFIFATADILPCARARLRHGQVLCRLMICR